MQRAAPIGRGAAIFGCVGLRLTPWEATFFRDCDPLGFILFARNVDTPTQVAALCADLRASVCRDAPILIDQEGGRVQRLRAPHWREFDPPLDAALAAGADGPRLLALRAQLICSELSAIGIDANCAPVADIAGPQTHPFLRNRCYGTDAAAVTRAARAVADAHLAMGVLPVMKHLPGHGRASADTHHDLPRVTASLADLTATDFAPFTALSDLPMAMTAHIIFDALDSENPATQSPAVIAHIRNFIGFGGLLLTDDLNMQALSGDLAQRTARALAAGCDIALHCKGAADEMVMVADAAGDMNDNTRARAQAALSRRGGGEPVDIPAIEAAISALSQGKEPRFG
jgi:beta-N-acetylhexosaminidase